MATVAAYCHMPDRIGVNFRTPRPWHFFLSDTLSRAMSTFVDEPQLRLQWAPEAAQSAVSSEADSTSRERQFLEVIQQVMAERPWEKLVTVTPEPPAKDVRPTPFDFERSMAAVDEATTAEAALAAVKRFLTDIEVVFAGGTDPFAALTTVFGTEDVATVTEVFAEAVADLEAEAAAAGGIVSDQAGNHIARGMVQRLIMRAGRTRDRAPRVHPALRGRVRSAPRARRAPRRAVRLSAVASAGDGPPAPEPPPTASPRDVVQLARARSRLLPVASVDDVLECIADLRERQQAIRTSHDVPRLLEVRR
jgi:hypothetical protein